ncbi:MAG: hypothetical protein ACOCX3_02270 [Chloroflexota bacterium]
MVSDAGEDQRLGAADPMIDERSEGRSTRQDGVFDRLRRWLMPTQGARNMRYASALAELDDAIALYPEAPMNYVLRGELYLKTAYYELARADFSQALTLAPEQIHDSAWGFIEQSAQDRARRGLKLAERKMRSARNTY